MPIFAELNSRLLGRNTWPIPSVASRWDEIELFRALRQSDEVRLRQEASVSWRYPYVVTPAPRMVSRASANMLYGEPADVRPASEGDADRMDFIVSENDLASENVRGAMIASSEGEVYGRILVQPAMLDAPIIEYVSGRSVIPHFNGRFLLAATFVSEWQEGRNDFYRLFETYEAGAITSELYRGGLTSIGVRVELANYPRTQGMTDQVLTGIARPLCAFIPNSIDDPPNRGFSDYRGMERRYLALNEAATIGQKNIRLAGQKRAFVDKAYLDGQGRLPSGDDVFVRKSRDASAGENTKPLDVLEYSFEAQATVAWIDHLLDSTLLLSGIAPTMVGRGVDGGAVSGTALRLKAAHSLIEASGKGRHFDRGLAWLLRCAAVIDSRRTTDNGFGRKWSEPDGVPQIERADALPKDDTEAAQRLVLLTNANAISTEEKVKMLHPEWDKTQIDDEVQRIESGSAAEPPTSGGSLTPPRPQLTLPGETPPVAPPAAS
jgi:hypothetical protein